MAYNVYSDLNNDNHNHDDHDYDYDDDSLFADDKHTFYRFGPGALSIISKLDDKHKNQVTPTSIFWTMPTKKRQSKKPTNMYISNMNNIGSPTSTLILWNLLADHTLMEQP